MEVGKYGSKRIRVTPSEKTCWVVDLGLVAYDEALAFQRSLVHARKVGHIPDVLLLCQHPHVITLGRSGKREHLLGSERILAQMGVAFCETDRGGDITYHGPGQLVGYPILDLSRLCKDVVWYIRGLEEIMIRATAEFGIPARRLTGKTGVWVDSADGSAEKLAAIGVHLSRWVTSHGFAYNVSTRLKYFDLIVPCGIRDCHVTSLDKLLGCEADFGAVSQTVVVQFGEVFGLEPRASSRKELDARLVPQPHGERELAAARA
jgi:lipoyl(octanoyl) transferase